VDTIFYSNDRILEIRFRPVPNRPLINWLSMLFSKGKQSQALVSSRDGAGHKFFAPGMLRCFCVPYVPCRESCYRRLHGHQLPSCQQAPMASIYCNITLPFSLSLSLVPVLQFLCSGIFSPQVPQISSSPHADFVSITMQVQALLHAFEVGAISAKSAQVLPGGWTEQVAKTCMKLRERVEGKGKMSMLNGELRFDLDSGRDHPNSSFKSHFG
jgi:hypothetical protein